VTFLILFPRAPSFLRELVFVGAYPSRVNCHYFLAMYSRLLTVPFVALLSMSVLAAPHGQNLMKRQGRPDNHTLNRERADAVKAAFEFAWAGYEKYAFPHDELHPVSNGYSDSRYVHGINLTTDHPTEVSTEMVGALRL
jgi:hypothetical protein